MNLLVFFHTYQDVIIGLSNIFIAIGTVGAVVVALWLSLKDAKPKLRVYSTVGIMMPEKSEYLFVTCVNVGKLPVTCNSFAFAPMISNPIRIMLLRQLNRVEMPKMIHFSEKIDQYFAGEVLSGKQISEFLSESKFLAKIKLKFFWRIVVNTNVGEFKGKLSTHLINKILFSQFPSSIIQPTEITDHNS